MKPVDDTVRKRAWGDDGLEKSGNLCLRWGRGGREVKRIEWPAHRSPRHLPFEASDKSDDAVRFACWIIVSVLIEHVN